MGVAITLQDYLDSRNAAYEVIEHEPAKSALRLAEKAHIPGDMLAKSILLGDDHGYLLAVIPATHRLEVDRLNQIMARDLEVIEEDEIEATFSDCECGGIPAIGEAYGVDTVIDTSLFHVPEIYFESGDRKRLIHMQGEQFRILMDHAHTVQASHHL